MAMQLLKWATNLSWLTVHLLIRFDFLQMHRAFNFTLNVSDSVSNDFYYYYIVHCIAEIISYLQRSKDFRTL